MRLQILPLEERVVFDSDLDKGEDALTTLLSGDGDSAAGGADTGASGDHGGEGIPGANGCPESSDTHLPDSSQDSEASSSPATSLSSSGATTSGATSSTNPVRILVVSTTVDQSDALLHAAQDDVVTVSYDASSTTLQGLLDKIESALGGRKAESIGIAVHDDRRGGLCLAHDDVMNLGSVMLDSPAQEFWCELGKMVIPSGRIDILACNVGAGEMGSAFETMLQRLSGVNVALSTDATGNPEYGYNWILESDGIDAEAVYFDSTRILDFTGKLDTGPYMTGLISLFDYPWEGNHAVAVDSGHVVVSNKAKHHVYVFYLYDIVDSTKEQKNEATQDGWIKTIGVKQSDLVSGLVNLAWKTQNPNPYPGVWTRFDEGLGDLKVGGTTYKDYSVTLMADLKTNRIDMPSMNEFKGTGFGYSVDISGNHVIVGAPNYKVDGKEGAGAAFVYLGEDSDGDHVLDKWYFQGILTAGTQVQENAHFGYSVSISQTGNEICEAVVGAPYYDGDGIVDRGEAYRFFWTHTPGGAYMEPARWFDIYHNQPFSRTGTWSGQKSMTIANGETIQTYDTSYVLPTYAGWIHEKLDPNARFGYAVSNLVYQGSVLTRMVAIGAPGDDDTDRPGSGGLGVGGVFVFTDFSPYGEELRPTMISKGVNFGSSIDLSWNGSAPVMIVGAPGQRAAYLYTGYTGLSPLKIFQESIADFGTSVAVDYRHNDNYIVVAANHSFYVYKTCDILPLGYSGSIQTSEPVRIAKIDAPFISSCAVYGDNVVYGAERDDNSRGAYFFDFQPAPVIDLNGDDATTDKSTVGNKIPEDDEGFEPNKPPNWNVDFGIRDVNTNANSGGNYRDFTEKGNPVDLVDLDNDHDKDGLTGAIAFVRDTSNALLDDGYDPWGSSSGDGYIHWLKIKILNYVPGDTIELLPTFNIVGSAVAGDPSVFVLTPAPNSSYATASQYTTAIQNLRFKNTTQDPTGNLIDISREMAIFEFVAYDGCNYSSIRCYSGKEPKFTWGGSKAYIKIIAVNDPPVLKNIDEDGDIETDTVYYYFKDPSPKPVLLDDLGDAYVEDPDSGNFENGTLTVKIKTNYVAGDELIIQPTGNFKVVGNQLLYHTTINKIEKDWDFGTMTYNSGILTIEFTEVATQARITELLHAIAYKSTSQDPTQNGTKLEREISFQITDGDGGTSAEKTIKLYMSPSRPPKLSNLDGDTVIYYEEDLAGLNPVRLDAGGNAILTDEDTTTFVTNVSSPFPVPPYPEWYNHAKIEVKITTGNEVNDRLTLYTADNVVTVNGGKLGPNTWLQNGDKIYVDGFYIANVTSNGQGTNSLTIQFVNDNDANASKVTAERVSKLLQRLAYANTETDNPVGGERRVTITAYDGDGAKSKAVNVRVNVIAVNDAPVVTMPAAAVTMFEDSSGVTFNDTGVGKITITDVDANNWEMMEATFRVKYGTLALGNPGVAGITYSGNNTSLLTVRGTLSAINNAIDGLTYVPGPDYFSWDPIVGVYRNPKEQLLVSVKDSGKSGDPVRMGQWISDPKIGTAVKELRVDGINDIPGFLPGPSTILVNEDSGLYRAIWATGMTVDASGAPSGNASWESYQTLSWIFTQLSITDPNLFSLAPSIDATGKLTFTPAPNAYGRAIYNLSLSDGIDTVGPVTLVIQVNGVNDAPVVTVGPMGTYIENGGHVVPGPAGYVTAMPLATLTDPDQDAIASTTITIANFQTGDELGFSQNFGGWSRGVGSTFTTGTLTKGGNTLTYQFVGSTLTLTTNAGSTLRSADYQEVFRAVEFNTRADETGTYADNDPRNEPVETPRVLSVVVTDQGGSGGWGPADPNWKADPKSNTPASGTLRIQNIDDNDPTGVTVVSVRALPRVNSLNNTVAAGTVVGTLYAIDSDVGTQSPFTYVFDLGGGAVSTTSSDGVFQIVGNTIVVVNPGNFQFGRGYTFNVRAQDTSPIGVTYQTAVGAANYQNIGGTWWSKADVGTINVTMIIPPFSNVNKDIDLPLMDQPVWERTQEESLESVLTRTVESLANIRKEVDLGFALEHRTYSWRDLPTRTTKTGFLPATVLARAAELSRIDGFRIEPVYSMVMDASGKEWTESSSLEAVEAAVTHERKTLDRSGDPSRIRDLFGTIEKLIKKVWKQEE